MDELNAAPSSTEPTAEELASIAMGTNAQEAGGAAAGESANVQQDIQRDSVTSPSKSMASGFSAQPADIAGETHSPLADAPGGATSAEVVRGATDSVSTTATGGDAPAVGGGVDAPSHLLMLDAMLAEIERKIAAGIHLFAHEVTAARDRLAKLL